MPTQIADIIVPAEFTAYIVENSLVSSALFQSGVAVPNGIMAAQLQAGAEFFTVPFWKDLPDTEANLSSDDPTVNSTPLKVSALQQIVRKSFVNQSWAQMDLASELSGSDALARIQNRVLAYWERQWEKRLIASLLGVLYSNVANNSADMVIDISGASGASEAGWVSQSRNGLPICITRTCSLTARSKKGPPSAWCFRKATHSSCPAYLQRPLNDAFRVGPTASSFPWKGVRVGISALGAFWSSPIGSGLPQKA
jgi:hypothetical protein